MNTNMGKKAAVTVPGLIILIMLFFAIYLYFLPISEKCKVIPNLAECNAALSGAETGGVAEKEKIVFVERKTPLTLFSENPGFLEKQEKSAVYSIKPVDIYNTENIDIAKILENAEPKKSWFASQEQKGVFSIHDRAKEIKLFVYVQEGKGKLYVNIAPRISYILEGSGLHQISLPVSLLNKTNIMRLEVSTPLIPSDTNYYKIEKVIVREIYSLTDFEIKRNLTLQQDMKQLESASLLFVADCITSEKLEVKVNDNIVKKETICDKVSVDIAKSMKNKNIIDFKSNGNYFIHPINIDLKFKEVENPTYYFDVDSDEFKDIKKGTTLVMVYLGFDSSEEKEMDIYINEEAVNIKTNNPEYKTMINDYLKEGQNSIKLVSRTSLKVNSFKLNLE